MITNVPGPPRKLTIGGGVEQIMVRVNSILDKIDRAPIEETLVSANDAIAQLEGGHAGLATGSGMAAVHTILAALAKAGELLDRPEFRGLTIAPASHSVQRRRSRAGRGPAGSGGRGRTGAPGRDGGRAAASAAAASSSLSPSLCMLRMTSCAPSWCRRVPSRGCRRTAPVLPGSRPGST